MLSRFPAIVPAVLLAAGVAGSAWSAEPSIADCDRLAAHPEDPRRVRAGVPFAEFDSEQAMWACEAALAAEPDSARFQFQYARALHKIDDLPSALKWYRKASDHDYAAAYYALGLIFIASKSMPWREAKAAEWFRKAAEAGHAGAQYRLGLLSRAGVGVPRDDAQALRWFRTAAAQGLARAQFALARIYDEGVVVAEDDALAAEWYRRAATQGYGRAKFALAALDPDAVEALDPGLSSAEVSGPAEAVAAVEEEDTPVPAATAEASPTSISDALAAGLEAYHAAEYRSAFVTWYPLAEQGVRRAEFYIGGLFMDGRGTDSDKVLAYFWLKRAALGGYAAAQRLLVELTSTMNGEEMARAEELIAAEPPGS